MEQVARGHAEGIAKAFGLKRKQLEREDKIIHAVQVLQGAEVIGDPNYWLQHARSGQSVKGENAAALIQKMADLLRSID